MDGRENRRHDPSRVGLLEQIARSTVDEEYAEAAATSSGSRARHAPLLALVVFLVFGAMLGISAIRTAHSAPFREQQREALVAQIHEQQRLLDDQQRQISGLRSRNALMQDRLTREATANDRTATRVQELAFNAGALPVSGPGLRIVVDGGPSPDDQVRDSDLQELVNGLWEAGAEGIAINGHRLGSGTSIRTAGQAITVNYISLTEPYVVEAVGDPDTLQARFFESAGGQLWASLQENFGFRFSTVAENDLSLVGNAHEHLLYAEEADR